MKILFYIRVSTDDQKVGLEMYRSMAETFCTMYKHELVDVYADEDVSGGIELFNRPEGKRLNQDLKSGKGDAIATPDVSRLFRDLRDGVNTLFDLCDLNVPVFTSNLFGQALDLTTPIGFSTAIELLKMAHMERLWVKNRTRDAMAFRRKNGKITSHIPYGYVRSTEDKSKLIKDVSEQRVIELILKYSQEGVGHTEIAKILNRNKIPTKRNKEWKASTIDRIVTYQKQVRA
jgi:DNA invertase Pin-like site-specific DNA recombinase